MGYEECPCSGNTLDRFLRPTVMAVLARHPNGLHGYLVARELEEVAIFGDVPPDLTGLYRTLRLMETEGYLRADWDTDGSGPARRVYALTEAGWHCLKLWTNTLESYARSLRQTIAFIKRSQEAVSREQGH